MKPFMDCLSICIACSMLMGCNNRIDTETLKLALKSDTLFIRYDELKDSVLRNLRLSGNSTEKDLLQRKALKAPASLTKEEQAKLQDINQNYATVERFRKATRLLETQYPDLKKMPSQEKDKLLREASSLVYGSKLLDTNALKLVLKTDTIFIKYETMMDSQIIYGFSRLAHYYYDMDSLLRRADTASLTPKGQMDLHTLQRHYVCTQQAAYLDALLEKKYPILKSISIAEKSNLYTTSRPKRMYSVLDDAREMRVNKLKAVADLSKK